MGSSHLDQGTRSPGLLALNRIRQSEIQPTAINLQGGCNDGRFTSYNKHVRLERVWNEKLSVVVILALSFFVSFCRTRLIVAWV